MSRTVLLAGIALGALLVIPGTTHAQSSPRRAESGRPARDPMMPSTGDLQGDPRSGPLAPSLRGSNEVAGIDAASCALAATQARAAGVAPALCASPAARGR